MQLELLEKIKIKIKIKLKVACSVVFVLWLSENKQLGLLRDPPALT